MSPGGDAEVASVVDGLEIAGRTVLDIGCGLGGPAVALMANHRAGKVVGIDIQSEQSSGRDSWPIGGTRRAASTSFWSILAPCHSRIQASM